MPINKGYIVIMSQELDNSVDLVINWLNYFGVSKVIRVTPEKEIQVNKITINNIELKEILKIDNFVLKFEEVNSFWIRNGYFSHDFSIKTINDNLNVKVNNFLNSEWKYLNDYLIFQLSIKKKRLGNYKELSPNKLNQLFYAKKVGLKIPDTNITSDQNINIKGDIITKPIKDIFTCEKDKIGLATKTKLLPRNIDQTYFFPSLIQKKIDKYFEIRIYFFDNKFYSAAIMTGENSEVDYRSEGNKENLRIVPYSIPKRIKHKLKKLMKYLQVESGSIDMIVSKELKYYYLEVNPVGYFDNISAICNFNIEKDIASYLLN